MLQEQHSQEWRPSRTDLPSEARQQASAHAAASDSSASGKPGIAAPSISLPKGGGAIRGIGEKFTANPVTGKRSMTVRTATSPGRSGFGPIFHSPTTPVSAMAPSVSAGVSRCLHSTRKTDKGLPQYLDAEESDIFVLSGAEDLVPLLGETLMNHVAIL